MSQINLFENRWKNQISHVFFRMDPRKYTWGKINSYPATR